MVLYGLMLIRKRNNVVIEVRDDGNGIDVEKVKQKAVEKGNLTQERGRCTYRERSY